MGSHDNETFALSDRFVAPPRRHEGRDLGCHVENLSLDLEDPEYCAGKLSQNPEVHGSRGMMSTNLSSTERLRVCHCCERAELFALS